ncbi:nucleoside diphosphate kinase 6 [Lasius niger]|uniref:Nucleoside diphosphate kinase 6 n=1 Tax=Lasius niger TaxID=67767 RepID=A0A0J7NLD1_LASNI|nr:nucleoside diphosphate kinase 6 [Lasius niger]
MLFFNLTIDETKISEDQEKTHMYNLDSNSNNSDADSSKLGTAVWDNKAVKFLFAVYEDHQDDFKSTCIKNDTVWDKIRMQINTKGYNFTKTQIKDKWMNMRKNYTRVKDHNKQIDAKLKTYRYYNEMDDLYGDKPNMNLVAIASNMRAKDENISSCSEDSATDDYQRKRKRDKVERHLYTWTEKFIQHSKEQADRKEQRQTKKIAAIENATKTFNEMMEKLIEKL